MINEFLKKLNNSEYGQKIRNAFNDKIVNDTLKYQKQYGFEIGTGEHATWNNQADAFKHAYMQAILYHQANKIAGKKAGDFTSKLLGNFHEWETEDQPLNENNMDLWNNEVGREVAKDVIQKLGNSAYSLPDEKVENFFANEIIKRMKKGELITTPKDKRKFEDREKYKHTIKDAKKSQINKSKGRYSNAKKDVG